MLSKKASQAGLKVSSITTEDFQAEMSKRAVRGRYGEIIKDVKEHNRLIKVEGLTKGQVAALARSAKEAEIQVKADYKNLYVILGPAPKSQK